MTLNWGIRSTPWSPCCSRAAARRALADIEIESRSGTDSWQASAAETVQVRRWLDELGETGSGRDAADRLVAWLVERDPEE